MKTHLLLPILFFCFYLGTLSAQNSTTIMNPTFRARTGSTETITKIERTSKYTKLYVHVVFRPNWWIMVNKETYLEDVVTGKQFKPIAVEGLNFDEQFYIPQSGEKDYVLTFSPLPKEVMEVNWIEPDSSEGCTYGISLRKNKKSSKQQAKQEGDSPTTIVWQEWVKNNPPISAQELAEAGKDFQETRFFRTDSAYISGVIDHYDSILNVKTGIIYLENELTRESRPTVITVHPDGTFEGKLLINYPIRFNLYFGSHRLPLYLEPGEHLRIYLDWEDLLERNRARINDFPLRHLQFAGPLAQVNAQLSLAPQLEFDFYFFEKDQKELTPDQYKEKWLQEWATWAQRVDRYMVNAGVVPKVRQLLKNEQLIAKAYRLFTYQTSRPYYASQDTANATLRINPTMEYYDFAKELLTQNYTLISDQQAGILINRMEYDWWNALNRPSSDKEVFSFIINDMYSFSYYRKQGVQLTKEENAAADWFDAHQGQNMEVTREQMDKWGAILIALFKREPKVEKLFAEKQKLSNVAPLSTQETNQLNLKSILLRTQKQVKTVNEYLQTTELPFMWQQVLTRACKSSFKFLKDKGMSTILVDSLCRMAVSHPYLQSEMKRMLAELYPSQPLQAYDLPSGHGAEIFKKLIAPYRGKVLFIDFWATTCGPCRQGIEMEDMKQLRDKYRNDDSFRFLYLTDESGSPLKAYQEYVEKHLKQEINFRVPASDYEYFRQLFHFNGIPRYVIISREGKVISEDYNFLYREKGILVDAFEADIQKWIKL
ncbi:TlpA disulfide reductase family protein [uncultured Bacteroides sp.]|uniref:TlpA family protein disulfide reductase n=1 Tax=uncultured Bacteroides sp. TaxID=162156 RepID=UPI00261A7251|nr:TlpA disulfide reductase family protein [uncultured Bacteroides sp.]